MVQYFFTLFCCPVLLVFAGGAVGNGTLQQALFKQGSKNLPAEFRSVRPFNAFKQCIDALFLKTETQNVELCIVQILFGGRFYVYTLVCS